MKHPRLTLDSLSTERRQYLISLENPQIDNAIDFHDEIQRRFRNQGRVPYCKAVGAANAATKMLKEDAKPETCGLAAQLLYAYADENRYKLCECI